MRAGWQVLGSKEQHHQLCISSGCCCGSLRGCTLNEASLLVRLPRQCEAAERSDRGQHDEQYIAGVVESSLTVISYKIS